MKIKETEILIPEYLEIQGGKSGGIITINKELNINELYYIKLNSSATKATEIVPLSLIGMGYELLVYSFKLTNRKIDIEIELPFQDVGVVKPTMKVDLSEIQAKQELKEQLKSEVAEIEEQDEPIIEEIIEESNKELIKQKIEKLKERTKGE